jgi:2-hydroxycyclohexanecarboxyl-CoA dehydrogenase
MFEYGVHKVVMITGAAGAIGKALCKRFHEEGALLVRVDSNKEQLDKLKSNYLPHDSEALYSHADCIDEAKVQKYVEKTIDLFGLPMSLTAAFLPSQ